MKNRESEEMYLETILVLRKQNGRVKSIEVADQLGYSRASVSRGMGLLKRKGYIVFVEDRSIEFTATGERRAQEIYERHDLLTRLLIHIGANAKLAEENACRLEHVTSPELIDLIRRFLESSGR